MVQEFRENPAPEFRILYDKGLEERLDSLPADDNKITEMLLKEGNLIL